MLNAAGKIAAFGCVNFLCLRQDLYINSVSATLAESQSLRAIIAPYIVTIRASSTLSCVFARGLHAHRWHPSANSPEFNVKPQPGIADHRHRYAAGKGNIPGLPLGRLKDMHLLPTNCKKVNSLAYIPESPSDARPDSIPSYGMGPQVHTGHTRPSLQSLLDGMSLAGVGAAAYCQAQKPVEPGGSDGVSLGCVEVNSFT